MEGGQKHEAGRRDSGEEAQDAPDSNHAQTCAEGLDLLANKSTPTSHALYRRERYFEEDKRGGVESTERTEVRKCCKERERRERRGRYDQEYYNASARCPCRCYP